MKNKFKILAITLIMILGFGLVSVNADPTPTATPTSYGITVNGIELTSATPSVTAGSGTVSYDADAKELTLNNATLSSTKDDARNSVISIIDNERVIDVTVKLVGTNTITNEGTGCYGILSNGNLTITGDGNLSITASGAGVYVKGNLTVENTTFLKVTSTGSNFAALYPCGNLTIDNSVVDLQAPNAAAIYDGANVAFNNLTGKKLQASNNPITKDTSDIEPTKFKELNKEHKYKYVKITGYLSKIAFTIKEPVVGETPASTYDWTVQPAGSATLYKEARWGKLAKDKYDKSKRIIEQEWELVKDDEKFQKDYYYLLRVVLEVADGYELSENIGKSSVTVNGRNADAVYVTKEKTHVAFHKLYGPLTEEAKSPATGDNNELGFFAVVGLLSVAAVALLLNRKHSE